MEKYSRFRDESTGIAPFQEARPLDFNILQTAALYVFGTITGLVSLLSLVVYFLIWKPLLPTAVSRFFLNNAVLLPLRVLYISFSYEGEHRASVRQKMIRRAQPGDVLLSNFTSPLDPLIYESRQRTHFVMPSADGHFQVVSTLGVVARALSVGKWLPAQHGARPDGPRGPTLAQIAKSAARAGAVVVVFVEGTTTNGRGLLTLKHLAVREIAELETQVYPAALRYTPATVVSPVPASYIGYLWRLAHSSWFYLVSVRIAGQPMPKSTITRAEISKSISAIGRLRILGDKLDVNSKREYVALRRNR